MDPISITKNTYKEIYNEYSTNNATLNEAVKKMLDKFIALLGHDKKILDIGCAGGRESKYLFDNGCEVTGMDLLEEFIEIAKKNCPQCEFLVGDMRTLPFDTSEFNGIWASASFLHIPKKDALVTLQGFNKVLQKQGLLYISVMQGEFDNTRVNDKMKWGERHFSDYQPNELENILEEANFEIVERENVITSWGPVFLHYFCRKK